MPSSSVRSAARPAFAAEPGVSTNAVSGSTKAAAPSSSSASVRALHHPHLRKSSSAPRTMAAETGVTSATVATSASSGRSAARRAYRAEPGAPTAAASGSTKAAAQNSSSARAASQIAVEVRKMFVILSGVKNPFILSLPCCCFFLCPRYQLQICSKPPTQRSRFYRSGSCFI